MSAQQTRQSPSVEFIVKPTENLYLEGGLRRLRRVDEGEPYPCQMQKTQQFSCLFRHYAKHNGLRKEDLKFTFVDELLPDQTPEIVHLMPQDEIRVEHREVAEDAVSEETPKHAFFADEFKALLVQGKHSDVEFKFKDPETLEETKLKAHKAILSARSNYFDLMFSEEGGMRESNGKEVFVDDHPVSFRRMLELLYTNEITELSSFDGSELYDLLCLSDKYQLESLWNVVQKEVAKVLDAENIARFILLTENHKKSSLRLDCAEYTMSHKKEMTKDFAFRQEVEKYPELGLFLMEASELVDEDGDGDGQKRKRRRVSGNNSKKNEIEDNAGTNTIVPSNANVDA